MHAPQEKARKPDLADSPKLRHYAKPWALRQAFGITPHSSRGLLAGQPLVVLLVKLFPRNLLFGHLGKLDQEVDDLFLVDRRAQAGERLRIVAVEVPNLLLLARELACAFDHGALHFLVPNLDLVLVANLRDDEAKPHATLRDLAVLGLGGLLGGAFVLEGATLLLQVVLDRLPYILELLI